MVQFERAINLIRQNNGFQANQNDSSFYRTYTLENSKPIQVRVSNHGTHLWTWIDRNYDPSKAINYCIVFSENGQCQSNTAVNMNIIQQTQFGKKVVGQRNNYEVIQYVYNCSVLTPEDTYLINHTIRTIWQTKTFVDPLMNDPIKKAKVMRLRPNVSPLYEMVSNSKIKEIITEVINKLLKWKIWKW